MKDDQEYTAESITIINPPYAKLFEEVKRLEQKRIAEAEKEQNVKICFGNLITMGKDENGLETIRDICGNKITLPPKTEDEIRLTDELDKEMKDTTKSLKKTKSRGA